MPRQEPLFTDVGIPLADLKNLFEAAYAYRDALLLGKDVAIPSRKQRASWIMQLNGSIQVANAAIQDASD